MGLTRREDLRAREGVDLQRSARRGAGSALYTVLFLAALALAFAISLRLRTTWDFSREGANSLSPKTREALASLQAPVSVHGLIKDADRRRESYWDLLQLYRRASPNISVEIFDPNARPGALEALGLAAVDRNAIKEGISVVVSGTRKTLFRGMSEEDVTNAILDAGSSEPRLVGFIRGYGEHDPASSADAGMSRAREALAQEYYDVADVRLDAPVPAGVTALVAAGPQAAIPKADLDRLAAWLADGGRLLVLADPDADPGLSEIVERWGLRVRGTKIVDRRNNLRGQPEILRATDFTHHPIVRGFSSALPLAFPFPSAVEDFEPGRPSVFHEPLVRTSEFAEGLTSSGARTQGPFVLAAAAYETHDAPGSSTETRVVLIGDVAFATNGFLAEESNRNFFLNCVGWLCRSRGQVSIRQAPLRGQALAVRRGDLLLFQALALGPPLLVIAAGGLVYLRRRRL